MSIFKMAWRNIWRNRRRSIVTIAAMSLALLSMILYSGLAEGMFLGLERNVVDMELGDVQVFAKGYRDKPQIYTRLAQDEELVSRLEKAGFVAAARLLGGGLAASEETSAGVSFRGVDVARDRKVSLVYQQITQGKWLDPASPGEVVIGRRLARTLAVEPGDEIVVLSQGADGSMANELYRVRGVLKGVSEAVDRGGIYMTTEAFRELMVVPSGSHQIIARRPATTPLPVAAAEIKALLPQHDVQSWKELMPTIASMMENARGMMMVMFLIIYLAIAIVILNAMLMAVFERIREFGVLKAVGMGPFTVLRLVLTESALQTLLAIGVGVGLGLPGVWYLSIAGIDLAGMSGISMHGVSWDMTWRATINANTFSGPIVTLVVVVFVAVLYPAIKAALISPVAAIQHR